MFRRIHVSAIVMIAIGCVLGYAVASGNLNSAKWASTARASQNRTAEKVAAASERPEGCCDGVNKGDLVALAAHNQKVAAESQKSGKKPNICIIWGDDIGRGGHRCRLSRAWSGHRPNLVLA